MPCFRIAKIFPVSAAKSDRDCSSLDKETSGCLAAAKNDFVHLELSRQFAARTIDKIYLALVAGKVRASLEQLLPPSRVIGFIAKRWRLRAKADEKRERISK